jgi:hypothetical protein
MTNMPVDGMLSSKYYREVIGFGMQSWKTKKENVCAQEVCFLF